jgi:hypothetical protein
MQWNKPLQDAQILGAIGDDGHGVYRGCYFGDFTRFAVFDVDQGSRYHTQQQLEEVTIALAEVGLTVTPYQSSNSGGWHLYLFLDNWESKDEVEQTLKSWLRSKGYEIKSGTLEVFPSGNALRLPLQKGFGWLSEDGTVSRRREDLTRDEAVSLFLSDLEQGKANWKQAKVLIDSQIAGFSRNAQEHQERLDTNGLEGLFQRGIDWDKYQRGRKYWAEGLSAFSQRTDAIICMGHYLWFGDDSIGLKPMPHSRKAVQRAELIYKRLERHHNGFSRTINNSEWRSVKSDIERACSWTSKPPLKGEFEAYALSDRLLKRLEWLYKITGCIWTVEDLQKGNIRRAENARNRIALAITQLEIEGQEINQTKVAKRAGACRKTVRKNRDLFGGWGGVYIGGGGDLVVPSSEPLSVLKSSQNPKLVFSSNSSTSIIFVDFPTFSTFSKSQPFLANFDLAQLNLKQFFLWKLTPYAQLLSGEGEQLNGMRALRLLSPSYPSSLASGSTSGALNECRLEPSSTCGINGFPPTLCAGPSHLILGAFFKRAQNVNLTACWKNRGRAPPQSVS